MSSPNHNSSSVGFLSSWLGYFITGRRDENSQHMFARNEQMLERMEILMNKIEEKLESLQAHANMEEKYEEEDAEEECSYEGEYSYEGEKDNDKESMETISAEELEKKGRSLHAYQEMVATNRYSWKYSANDLRFGDIDPNLMGHEADSILHLFESIKNCTIKMRRGEYHHEGGSVLAGDGDDDDLDFQGILLGPRQDYDDEPTPYISGLRPHWDEFAQALNDFDLILDVMPDDTESCFRISHIELPVTVFMMIVKSLDGKPFKHYKFINNQFGTYGIRALIDLLDSNQELKSLELRNNSIDEEDENDVWTAIGRHPNLTKINIDGCCEGGRLSMLCGIIQWNKMVGIEKSNNLVDISWRNNGLNTAPVSEWQFFSKVLASNDFLERLDLSGNNLNDRDAALIATALETNSTLKLLLLGSNRFTAIGGQHFGTALRVNNTLEYLMLGDRQSDATSATFCALFDDTSLNSAADSNHICCVGCYLLGRNEPNDAEGNRQRKIYNILARRNKDMSNVQHFDEIDINLFPEILLAVQRYSNARVPLHLFYGVNLRVNALSIVYELVRKWDKAYTRIADIKG
jgi:hypothetical protein